MSCFQFLKSAWFPSMELSHKLSHLVNCCGWNWALGLVGVLVVLGMFPPHTNSSVCWKLSAAYVKPEHLFPLCVSDVVPYHRARPPIPQSKADSINSSGDLSDQLLTQVPWHIRVLLTNRTNGMCIYGEEIYFKELADKFKIHRVGRQVEEPMLWCQPEGCQAGEFLLALGGQSLFYPGLQLIGWGPSTGRRTIYHCA